MVPSKVGALDARRSVRGSFGRADVDGEGGDIVIEAVAGPLGRGLDEALETGFEVQAMRGCQDIGVGH